MKDQLTLLEGTDWDVLIVLDACRADYFRALLAPQIAAGDVRGDLTTVRSPFVHTPGWIHRVGPLMERLNPVYFTANPVVDREVKRRGFNIELVSVWKTLWGDCTVEGIPSVHPFAVNGCVLGRRDFGDLKGRKVVVHYVQPHAPYIGRLPLKMGRFGQARHPFGRACHRLPRPDQAVKRGETTWETVRAAYAANLELVWGAARHLMDRLGGRCIVTADHGELLGEDGGKFGHEGNWRHDELFEVPWLVLRRGRDCSQQELSRPGASEGEDEDMQSKLKALGYV